jgi:Glu-tRNA(Gln) amidotransferase subunit E-like FAD-binding protein
MELEYEKLKEKLKKRSNAFSKVDLNYIKTIYYFWNDESMAKSKIMKMLKTHPRRVEKVDSFIKDYLKENKLHTASDEDLKKIMGAYNEL